MRDNQPKTRTKPAKAAPGKFRIGRTVLFHPEQFREIEALASADSRSFSSTAVRLIDEGIEGRRRRAKRAAA